MAAPTSSKNDKFFVTFPGHTASKITKWKVKDGHRVSAGTLLGFYDIVNGLSTQRLKCPEFGIINEILVSEGDVINPGDNILELRGCDHPVVMKDMCAECGADLRVECGFSGERKEHSSASVAMVHSIPELIVSEQQAVEIGKEDEARLLEGKKLVLLVDLDQTLLHTTNDTVPNNLKDVIHFQLWHGNRLMWYHTKFRPGTERFLERVSEMYELHICTFGARMYAHTMARHLDPDGKYFSHRILSRDECFNPMSKTANLRALFPCGDSMVCIIDDREDIWSYAPHLVHVKPYRFFKGTADINAPPGCDKTDDVSEEIHADDALHQTETETPKKESENDEKETDNADNNGEETVASIESCATLQKEPDLVTEKPVTEATVTKEPVTMETATREPVTMETVTKEPVTNEEINVLTELEVKPHSEEEAMEVDSSETLQSEAVSVTADDKDDTEMISVDQKKTETTVKTESTVKTDFAVKTDSTKNADDIIEWNDPDDYLLYLEDVLTRIHKAYYDFYNEHITKKTPTIPDLKNIIPYVKRKVLKGVNLAFSGVVPKNIPHEQCKAWQLAKSLGANIQEEFVRRGENPTTHVVAAKLGTAKVNQALRDKRVKLVTLDWLWCCAHRWENVDERLFLLKEGNSRNYGIDSPVAKTKRKLDDTDGELASTSEKRLKLNSPGSSQEESINFQEGISPMHRFSKEDLDSMDKELHDLIGSCSESDDESSKPQSEDGDSRQGKMLESRLRIKVLSGEESDSSSAESLSADYPRGWKHESKRRESWPSPRDSNSESEASSKSADELEDKRRLLIQVGRDSDSSDLDSDVDSIGSVDEEMAEAVEREFLN